MRYLRSIIFTFIFFCSASVTVQGQGYIAFGYGPSIPMGKLTDYINKTSWRAINLEAGYFVTKDLAIGAAFSWYGYYKSLPYDTYYNIQGTTVTVSGRQWRYCNVYPLVAVFKYYIPLNGSFKPFVGAGFGPYFVNRRLDFGVYSLTEHSTQFGFYPELGLSYWFNNGFALSFDAKYNYSLRNNDLESHSNLALNLGLVWKFGSGF